MSGLFGGEGMFPGSRDVNLPIGPGVSELEESADTQELELATPELRADTNPDCIFNPTTGE